ncbi:MAG: NADH:flavin oxidoreductase [Actinobacteria bacterium]|nr:NADH:flavin oxidoreductase [Actinomycetota bacterium]
MSILFNPAKIGEVEIRNRFVHAATYESMAEEDGRVTDMLVQRYSRLARGEVGLIITGIAIVHPLGNVPGRAIGIYSDAMIPGLKRLAEAVHEHGAKIFIQLLHAGAQTNRQAIGRTPLAPSLVGPNPMYLNLARPMREREIEEAIRAFGQAARRAAEAGADGVHIAASGGYLLNEFLSPYFNRRKDGWGGSDENRFRIMREVIREVRRNLAPGMALTVKLTANDYTPREGITTPLAARYAKWMAELGIDALEIASGCTTYSGWHIWRGGVPVKELVKDLPGWQKPVAWLKFRSMAGKYDFSGPYNLEDARVIKAAIGEVPFILVGGLRRLSQMEEIAEKGEADFVALSRPLVREPNLVKKFREGRAEASSCISCNKCFAEIVHRRPLRCMASGG